MDSRLNIFDFSDYRAFVSGWLKHSKDKKIFNLSRLAEAAQIHPTFLSHVLKGDKHLSLEQAAYISQKMRLTHFEQEYFFILIQSDRAGTPILRSYWMDKKSQLLKEKNKVSKNFEKNKELTLEQKAIFYSNWLYTAVWVSTSINEKQSITEIAKAFDITRSKADEILQFLTEAGLVAAKDGFYSMGEVHIHVDNESPFVVKHHLNWRMRAIQRMDSRSDQDLFFTAPMSVSIKDIVKIRDGINTLIEATVKTAKNSKAEQVVCLNIDYFAVLDQPKHEAE